MGDGRTYDYTLALRAVTTDDFMTADWARIPYDVLDRISVRIVNEVPGITGSCMTSPASPCHGGVGVSFIIFRRASDLRSGALLCYCFSSVLTAPPCQRGLSSSSASGPKKACPAASSPRSQYISQAVT